MSQPRRLHIPAVCAKEMRGNTFGDFLATAVDYGRKQPSLLDVRVQNNSHKIPLEIYAINKSVEFSVRGSKHLTNGLRGNCCA